MKTVLLAENISEARRCAIVGHAFGNRLARTVASKYPDLIDKVILIAAGGKRPIAEAARTALRNCFNPDRSPAEHEADIRYGFFAPGNDIPAHWSRGWHATTALVQGQATHNTESGDWWRAGGRPMLVVQGLADTIAPKEDTTDLLVEELGAQVTSVVIEHAGHALLPEQPGRISEALIDYLSR